MKKTHFLKGSKAILLYLFVVFTGCTYHDINDTRVYMVCECKTNKIERIKDEGGIITSTADGYKIISVNHGYLTSCVDIPSEYQVDGMLVYFSGEIVYSNEIISTCIKEQASFGLWSTYISLESVKKADTLYVNESPQIRIVKTEDYGLQPGFGYTIYDVQKDFRLQQFAIPWIPSQIPYKTETDALKMAFVMGYRLENFKGYPYLVLADLYFTQIQGI